jgi:hypothetical protein
MKRNSVISRYGMLPMVRSGLVASPCRYVTFYGHVRHVIMHMDAVEYVG